MPWQGQRFRPDRIRPPVAGWMKGKGDSRTHPETLGATTSPPKVKDATQPCGQVVPIRNEHHLVDFTGVGVPPDHKTLASDPKQVRPGNSSDHTPNMSHDCVRSAPLRQGRAGYKYFIWMRIDLTWLPTSTPTLVYLGLPRLKILIEGLFEIPPPSCVISVLPLPLRSWRTATP